MRFRSFNVSAVKQLTWFSSQRNIAELNVKTKEELVRIHRDGRMALTATKFLATVDRSEVKLGGV